jgi:hypothetical protein
MRMLLIGRNLGLHAPFLFPATAGLNYESTRYLRHLEEHRGKFTLFSGVSHLRYNNHHSEAGLFTGVPWDRIKEPAKKHHNGISLDQYAAERIEADTRFRNLVIGQPVQWNFSWNDRGVPVPSERSPAKSSGNSSSMAAAMKSPPKRTASEPDAASSIKSALRRSPSVKNSAPRRPRAPGTDVQLDSRNRTKPPPLRSLGESPEARRRILKRTEDRPNGERELVARETLWFDITRLAFQTDSTRVILLTMGDAGRAKLDGLNLTHHDASHHGKDETKVEQLAMIEETELKQLSRFLTTMQQAEEGDSSLFDRTSILNVSNLSNASAHTCENLPVILAGGGYKHQGHVLKDLKNNTPLSNLFVRMLQQTGIETKQFGASEGVLSDV